MGEDVKETSFAVGVDSLPATAPCRTMLTCLYGGVDGDLDVLSKRERKTRVHKPSALSVPLFSKATEMMPRVLKCVSAVDNV